MQDTRGLESERISTHTDRILQSQKLGIYIQCNTLSVTNWHVIKLHAIYWLVNFLKQMIEKKKIWEPGDGGGRETRRRGDMCCEEFIGFWRLARELLSVNL